METAQVEDLYDITEVELVYKRQATKPRPKITDSFSAFEVLRACWDANKIELVEQFKILLLDQANQCIGISEIGLGGIAGCVADLRIIFATALKGRAVSILIAHNHPSGNLTPSGADKALTQKCVEAGGFLDIKVIDHLILTPRSFLSFADEGIMPRPS